MLSVALAPASHAASRYVHSSRLDKMISTHIYTGYYKKLCMLLGGNDCLLWGIIEETD